MALFLYGGCLNSMSIGIIDVTSVSIDVCNILCAQCSLGFRQCSSEYCCLGDHQMSINSNSDNNLVLNNCNLMFISIF